MGLGVRLQMSPWWQKIFVFVYVEVCLYIVQCVTMCIKLVVREATRRKERLRLHFLSYGRSAATCSALALFLPGLSFLDNIHPHWGALQAGFL